MDTPKELALYRDGFCKQEFKGHFEKTAVHVHPKERGVGGGGRIKMMGMLVISVWGVNCRFSSYLGCLGWKVTIILICPFRYPLVLCIKKFTKITLTLATQRGQFKLEPHPQWSLLGVKFEFSNKHPHQFYVGLMHIRRFISLNSSYMYM